jgi:hypothetical protein
MRAAVSCEWESSLCPDIVPSLSSNIGFPIKKILDTYSFIVTFKLDIYIPLPIGAQELIAHRERETNLRKVVLRYYNQ